MIEKKGIYSDLRRRSLEFFPAGSFSTYNQQNTFQQWLLYGNYTVKYSTNSEIVFEANKEDIASVFLVELENYSNHSYEHLLELFTCQFSKNQRSDAWNVVTGYYFGFFLVQSLLRILGNPVIYIPTKFLSVAQQLSSMSGGFPKGGTFVLKKEEDLSATQSLFSLKQTRRKIHEGSWHQLMIILKSSTDSIKNIGYCDNKEFLFYSLIATNKLFKYYTNYEWPSSIRNKCNYNPGYSYKLLINKTICKSKNIIKKWEELDYSGLVNLLDASVKNCNDNIDTHVNLMFTISLSLFSLNKELYLELLTRRHIDKRWEGARRKFLKTLTPKDKSYPFISGYC